MADIVTRYPNGVNDATEVGALANYAGMRPSRNILFWDDFLKYTATDWVVTETDAGTTEAIVAAGTAGQLAITNVSAGATDAASLQWSSDGGTTAATQWTFDSTKGVWIGVRFKVDSALLTAFVIGLAIADTTPVASLPANGIFFNKVGASASLLANLRASAASSTVTLGTMADDTFVTAHFVYNPVTGYWQGYLNDVLIGSITAPTTPSVALTPTIGLLNASAAAHVLTIDWLLIAQQR